jgi:hypothetical protein
MGGAYYMGPPAPVPPAGSAQVLPGAGRLGRPCRGACAAASAQHRLQSGTVPPSLAPDLLMSMAQWDTNTLMSLE